MKFSLTDFIIIISKTAFCICNISICPSFGELPYRKMYSKVNGSVSKCKATELKGTRGLSHFYGIYIGGAVTLQGHLLLPSCDLICITSGCLLNVAFMSWL